LLPFYICLRHHIYCTVRNERKHPKLVQAIIIAGKDGNDAKLYLEKLVNVAEAEGDRRMNSHYSLIIQWSEEDKLFVVSLPEFTDVMQPCTHGHTYEEAAKHGQELLETLIELYQEDGKPLPEPKTLGKRLQIA
jgi:predicted RNase H-like HicB family nuclease